ncbi:MAG: MarR family transcriptional regulator [Desulfuromonas sp.]|nr:MAG: MarR family transcriptional regulator [Desulfuromonas sp.]
MSDAGLTISQFGVLEALLHRGPLCQKDIAAKILKSSGNITMVIDNLVKRCLVRRERSETDRRFITIHLTPEGSSLINEVFPQVSAAIVDNMAILSSEEQELLGQLCRRLGRQD